MFKRSLVISLFSFMILNFLAMTAMASTDPLQEEFEYFLGCGRPSENFFVNITAHTDKTTKSTILSLQKEERELNLSPSGIPIHQFQVKGLKKIRSAWLDLSHQAQSTLEFSLLCLHKVLNLQWDGETAIELADKCHAFIEQEITSQTLRKSRIAYRGLVTLGVKLKEPDFDLHRKLRPLDQLIMLLEDLKDSAKDYKSGSELNMPEYFDENCIPQAETCCLLMVAYGGYIILDPLKYSQNVQPLQFSNGTHAISLYVQGLQGSTTPAQRQYYHTQIVNLVWNLKQRVPYLLSKEVLDYYNKLAQKNSLESARIIKDEMTEINKSEKPLQWCSLAYKAALAYFYAGKPEKALSYAQNVMNFQLDETPSQAGIYLQRLKVRIENLVLQFQDPSKVFEHQVKNWDVFVPLLV